MKVDYGNLNSVEEDADIKACSRQKKYKWMEPFWYQFNGRYDNEQQWQFWRTATSTADAKPFVALTRVLHCIEHMFMKAIAMFLLSITAEQDRL